MPNHTSSPRYCAYMLRCWHEGGQSTDDTEGWRFTIEDPHTGARRGFASFASLVAFLHKRLLADPCREGALNDEQADEGALLAPPV